MAVEKVSLSQNIVPSVSFKGNEEHSEKEVKVDEEKSDAMLKKVGLSALAALAIGGGIIYYVKKGRAPKASNSATSSVTASTPKAPDNAANNAPEFEPVKKFMRKLKDGTEYLFKTEERDKDGNLLKSVRYAKDGKTVERVREFKMFPAGANTPAHNVVASEIRYGKNGEVVYKRTAHADGLGYDLERLVEVDNTLLRGKATFVTHLDGNRFRPVITSSSVTDAKTDKNVFDLQFGPGGEDDVRLMRRFDKKTGTKVIYEMQRLSDDTYKATEFGQGQSRRVSIVKDGKEDAPIQFERYDSQGRLRQLYATTQDGSFTRFENPVKGRVTIYEEINGDKNVTKKYTKDGEIYTQKFITDDVNPENNRIEVYKGDELVHTVSSKKATKTPPVTIDSKPQAMIDTIFSREVDADDVRNTVARTSADGMKEWNSAGELLRDGDVQYRYQGEITFSGSDGEHAWRTLDFGNGNRVGYMKLDNKWIETGRDTRF